MECSLVQLNRLEGFLAGLRNEKRIISNKIRAVKNPDFYLSPIPDSVGDCGRAVFIKFHDQLLANKMDALLKMKGIDSFIAFSEGHTATCWNHILSSGKMLKRVDENLYRECAFEVDIRSIQKSEEILKSTLGIKTSYNRSNQEINLLSEQVHEVLNKI